MNLLSLLRKILVIIVEITFVVPLLEGSSRSTNLRSSDVCANLSRESAYDSDDSFSAVQCKGEKNNGRCFCYSPSGSRIFGWSWWSSEKNITCRCSRQRHRLNTQLGRNDVSLHCTQDGNYEQLQCDNELCWCVESTSGKPKERLYPQSIIKYLPCYTEKTSGMEKQLQETSLRRYLRQCESKALARLAILGKLKAHGQLNTHIDEALCDDDGTYGKYKIEKKRVYCVWKDSKKIDNFQSDASEILLMDCNCARDIINYAEENLEMLMSCQTNGNYESSQMSNGRPYCVDSDGFATTELGELGENLNCPTVV